MNDLKTLCAKACQVAKEAGLFIKHERANFNMQTVEIKSFNQLVSYVDKNAEEKLVNELQKLLPQAGFITEEQTIATQQKEWMWVIDPLDGTTNFIHGLPVFSVSIGLLQNNNPMLGVVYEVNRNEMFYAWKDGGAWLDGTKIFVKQNTELSKSLLATGFPYYNFIAMEEYINALKYLMINTQGMRRMGSAAVDLAYTACGRFDAFFEYGLSPWDIAGGVCLIREAGGIVSNFSGHSDVIFSKSIVGSSAALYPQFMEVIQSNFTTTFD